MIAQPLHGGDVRAVARAAGRDAREFIDFSANINPLGPPPSVRALLRNYAQGDALTQYPEPGSPELTSVLARRRGIAPEHIVVHGGSVPLFDAVLRACAPRRVGLCLPAFAEYARAAAANRIDVRTFALDPRGAPPLDLDGFRAWVRREAIDAVILTNPHNPLGFALPAARVRELIAHLPLTTFIVDEAFADYDERVSVVRDAAANPRVIVIRSVTKFFAMPDLRVGYAVMTAQNARAVAQYIPAWPVCGIAAAAAAVAVVDDDYARRTREHNAAGREQLRAGLSALGADVLDGAANFVTFRTRHAGELRARLITEHRIVVRDCSSFAGLPPNAYVRIAVRGSADNALLLEALAPAAIAPLGEGER